MTKIVKTILVIEDNPVMVRMLQEVLKRDGYEVDTAYNGAEGLEKARSNPPVIILFDIILPDIDGKEVARHLKADSQTQDIPIVFLTITLDPRKDKGSQTITIDGQVFPAMAKPMHTRRLLSILKKETNKRIQQLKKKSS